MKVIKVRELQDVVYDRYPEVDEAINELLYDVQPFIIIQCKDCKYCITHYRGSLGYYCARDYNEFRVEPNDFCSKGEQKC